MMMTDRPSLEYEVLTGPQPAGVAVVRLRGEGVLMALRGRFSRVPATPGRFTHSDLRDMNGELVDDVVLAWIDGEDSRGGAGSGVGGGGDEFELSCHGGPEVVRQVCAVFDQTGFRESKCAETSPSVERLIPLCRTELALRMLLESTRPTPGPAWGGNVLRHLLHPPTVAIVGPANVGKSTLVNALSRTDAAIVADLPGTTRDYVLAEAELARPLGGFIVRLIDTPGERQGGDHIEQVAQQLARDEVTRADLILLVVTRDTLDLPETSDLIQKYPAAHTVWNRMDIDPPPPDWKGSAISAVTGQGLKELEHQICHHFGLPSGQQ